MLYKAVASWGGGQLPNGGGLLPPPGPVEPDKSSLWMDLFSLGLSYFDCSDLQLFAIPMAKKLVGPRCVQIVN